MYIDFKLVNSKQLLKYCYVICYIIRSKRNEKWFWFKTKAKD